MGLTKATITNIDTNESLSVAFNPTEYTLEKTNNWNVKPSVGRNVPQRSFTGGQSQKLTMDIFFDVFEQEDADVRDLLNKLWTLTKIDASRVNDKTQKSRPPLCLFQWGSNWYFKAALTNMKVRYTLFRESGIPARATASITLEEAEDDDNQPSQNPTSHAEPGLRRREVRPQDTLATIAYEEYGDPNKWRSIADYNHLDNPLAISPGQVLSIPSLS